MKSPTLRYTRWAPFAVKWAAKYFSAWFKKGSRILIYNLYKVFRNVLNVWYWTLINMQKSLLYPWFIRKCSFFRADECMLALLIVDEKKKRKRCSYLRIGNHVHAKSSRVAPRLAIARLPGRAKYANAPPSGLTRRTNGPQRPGRWAQLELTDV